MGIRKVLKLSFLIFYMVKKAGVLFSGGKDSCLALFKASANFDIRYHDPSQMTDESAQGYYFQDQKTVVTRVPQVLMEKVIIYRAIKK